MISYSVKKWNIDILNNAVSSSFLTLKKKEIVDLEKFTEGQNIICRHEINSVWRAR